MDRQLKTINANKVRAKAQRDMALTLKELAVWKGVGYSIVRSWQNDGLPMLGGYVFPSLFNLWAQSKTGLLSANGNEAHRSPPTVDKFGESP